MRQTSVVRPAVSVTQLTLPEMTVEVVRKRVKHLYLTVLQPDGRVRVTAPHTVTDPVIHQFLTTRLSWIRKHQERIRSQTALELPEYLPGDLVPLWGQPHILSDQLVKKGDPRERREAAVLRWYRRELEAKALELIHHWQGQMGVTPAGVRIRSMKTRWGVCNVRTRQITLNLELVRRNPICLEYIVVHELAHLLIGNHSRDFYRLVEQHLPDWKTAKAALTHR